MLSLNECINRKQYVLRMLGVILFALLLIQAGTSLQNPAAVQIVLVAGALGLSFIQVVIIKQRANDIGWHPWLLTFLVYTLTPVAIIIAFVPGKTRS